jgi:hypothetical protein
MPSNIWSSLGIYSNPEKQTGYRRLEQLGDVLTSQTGPAYTQPAIESYGTVTDFLKKLLGGDRAEMMSALGPEVKTIRNQNEAATRAISQFAPRGGGRATILAEQPYNMAAQIQALLQKVRPQAATQLAEVAKTQGQLGLQTADLGRESWANMLNFLTGQPAGGLGENSKKIAGEIGKALMALLI